MEFLKHQRDETVHNGIRGAKHSLSDCVDCHASVAASGEATGIDEEGEFCAGCHEYSAVSIDCFQCHRTVPREQKNALAPQPLPRIGDVEFDLGAPAVGFWLPMDSGLAFSVSGRD